MMRLATFFLTCSFFINCPFIWIIMTWSFDYFCLCSCTILTSIRFNTIFCTCRFSCNFTFIPIMFCTLCWISYSKIEFIVIYCNNQSNLFTIQKPFILIHNIRNNSILYFVNTRWVSRIIRLNRELSLFRIQTILNSISIWFHPLLCFTTLHKIIIFKSRRTSTITTNSINIWISWMCNSH